MHNRLYVLKSDQMFIQRVNVPASESEDEECTESDGAPETDVTAAVQQQ